MLRLANIHSLSDFRHNSKTFIEQMRTSGAPLVLTVNGRAEIVVYDAEAFQAILDELDTAKTEIEQLKTELAEIKGAENAPQRSSKRSA